jgi:hypothetical protein
MHSTNRGNGKGMTFATRGVGKERGNDGKRYVEAVLLRDPQSDIPTPYLFFENDCMQGPEAGLGKRNKFTRDHERDVSEQIALGQSNIVASGVAKHEYDQRLFDQDQGVVSGFHGDDAYDVYDKPLFHEKVGVTCHF